MRRGRILALDFGTKNVGLATCDELGITVSPLPSIPNRNRRDLSRRLKGAVEKLAVDLLVVGIPLHMNGSTGASAARVERFMQHLQKEIAVPVRSVDERLSTVEATEIWRGMTLRQQRKYRTLDSLAAAIILERFLREE